MKKYVIFLAVLLLSFALTGCNSNRDKGVTDNNNNNAAPNDVVKDNDVNNDVVDDKAKDINNDHETKLEVAEDAAARVTDLDEVDRATVLVTDRNAYVAVVMTDNTDMHTNTEPTADEEIAKELEDKIADKVREANNNIENVYVSLNPDFVERMTDYRTRIDEGKPIAGFFEEFTESVRNVFPDAH